MKTRSRLLASALGVTATALALITTATPAEAKVTTRICASGSQALYVDGNYANGYSWRRFTGCRDVDSNDVFKTNGESFALVRGLYRIQCINYSITRIDPTTDGGNLAGYPRKDCKR